MSIFIGCAGWSVPTGRADKFPGTGSHLERYASQFNCVEINSSFYRPHQRKTYERWAAATPSGFQFAVKVPRQMTHDSRLQGIENDFLKFMTEVTGLGNKLGPLLVQLPPSLVYDPEIARTFFSVARSHGASQMVCEPRHPTWFTSGATALLEELEISRVAADPPIVPEGFVPAGHDKLVYWRLHGSPKIYYSAYETPQLETLAQKLTESSQSGITSWCIFDNTALGSATDNALTLINLTGARRSDLGLM